VAESHILPGTAWLMAGRALPTEMIGRCIFAVAGYTISHPGVIHFPIFPASARIMAGRALPFEVIGGFVSAMASDTVGLP